MTTSHPYRESPSELGPLLRVHRDRGNGCLIVALALLVAVLGAWMLVMGLPIWQGGAYFVVAVGGAWLAMRWMGRHGGYFIELYEHGIVQHAGAKVTSIRFDEVTALTRDIRQTYRYWLSNVRTESHSVESRDGRVIRFSLMSDDAPALRATIAERALPRIRLETLRAIDGGETVTLGPFAVSSDGLRVSGEPLVPWSEIGRAKIDAPSRRSGGAEMIRVERPSGELWTQRGVSLVPNADLLVEIIELAVEAERAPPEP